MIFAPIALIVLLLAGISLGELRVAGALFWLAAAAGALVAFYLLDWPITIYIAGIGVADIVLIIVIFKCDLRIH